MKRLLFVLLFAGCASSRFVCDATSAPHPPRNFGVVSQSVYRGGQPMTCGELAFLQSEGVRSILKLNDRNSPVDIAEKENAARLGMHIESFDFNAHTIGTAASCDDVRRALAFLEDRANGPVYVHCTAGKDRTGYIAGLYERTHGRTIAEVMEELRRYGHSGARAAAFSQIDRELESEVPQCATAP